MVIYVTAKTIKYYNNDDAHIIDVLSLTVPTLLKLALSIDKYASLSDWLVILVLN